MIELRYNFLEWFKRHHFLYVLGFLAFFKPFDPFLYELIITSKNVTEQHYLQTIQPISGYTSLVTSLIIFIFISFCLFNYVLVFTCCAGWMLSILLWKGDEIYVLGMAEGLHGCFVATEIVYYASIYLAQDSIKDFSRASSYINAMPLLAKVVSGILAQLLVSKKWLSYDQLPFLTLIAGVHASFVATIHLPPIMELQEAPQSFLEKIDWFKMKFKETMVLPHVYKWCIWAGLAICGRARFVALMQPYWRQAMVDNDELLNNGALEGISAFLALLAVLLSGMIGTRWKHENSFFCGVSVLTGALLLGLANIDHVWDSTIIYLVLEIIFHFAIAKCSAMIAETIYNTGCFGMAFGLINLVSSIFNLVFVHIVHSTILNLNFNEQFTVHAIYHFVIAGFMALCFLLKI